MSAHRKTAVWKPNQLHETNIQKFIHHVNQKHGFKLETYHDLHRWSVDETTFQDFWTDAYAWLQLGPQDCSATGSMLTDKVASSVPPLFPPPTFFPSASLNIAEIILRDRKDGDGAIYFAREGVDGLERITWGNIREQVRQLHSAMIRSGVKRGDVVAVVMGNSVNTIIAALATLSIGAIWTSASCDLGPSSIIDRYSQVSPKVVFADDGYVYAGRISQWSGELRKKHGNELVNVVIVPYCGTDVNLSSISGGCTLSDFLARDQGDELGFEMVGGPKCIIHSMGGVALKVKVDMTLQHDIRSSDVVFQYTTILQDTGGIMMLGRSDGVLNPSGVRFGSAEIYAVTETLPEISDCICVGQRREIDEDERVLLFVKMSPGQSLTAELETKIASAIREGCSPRHVPREIFEVSDIPYTPNGKKCEINVKHVINGRKVTVNGAVANPEALKMYEKYRELPAERSQGLNRAKL
ncbi:hypothetical protein CEP52_005584 [Fusarium oligoseptatum]|uniref:Uncharacterized protein n=1 Tax=Fusarium oligoseptatum TaxID=2604345 RepID=A0A428TXK2_9HYPO|nr:hypothetical protein CEP52_005584 [Fusarium oligoseptatum]